ncbi:MAG: DegT/DnrJ/EryC1/StrS family aminotransferase [bacterium]|nr:DegT/DnrJ/EryC1/StrS family aminotransferase [bacterium]
MYIPQLQTLPLNTFFKHSNDNCKEIFKENIITFRYGRNAIWWGLKYLDIKSGENVLVPSSLCDVVIDPFVSLGINLKYYSLDKSLKYGPEEIRKKIDKDTRAVYVIHYFGFPQDLSAVKDICDKNKLFLIEDCAHSFLGSFNGKPLGDFGDISIFSPRKFLPVPDGGFLKINKNNLKLPAIEKEEKFIPAAVGLTKLILKDMAFNNLIPLGILKKALKVFKEPEDNLPLTYKGSLNHNFNEEISFLSKYIINKLDLDEVIDKRRKNFNYWINILDELPGIKPLFSQLPEGVVPYSFPVLIEKRDEFLIKFENAGMFFEPTLNWTFYNLNNLLNKNEKFSDTQFLAERFLSLPVYQSLDLNKLEKIRKRMAKILCK